MIENIFGKREKGNENRNSFHIDIWILLSGDRVVFPSAHTKVVWNEQIKIKL